MVKTKFLKYIVTYIPKDGLILDAGCGDCQYADFLYEYTSEVVCLDLKIPLLNKCSSERLLRRYLKKLLFKNQSSDRVYSGPVFEFLIDEKFAIDEIYRVLKPHGTFIFSIHTKRSVFRILKNLELKFGTYQKPEFNVKHYHYYDKKDINKLVKNKFEILAFDAYNYNSVPLFTTFLIKLLDIQKEFLVIPAFLKNIKINLCQYLRLQDKNITGMFSMARKCKATMF